MFPMPVHNWIDVTLRGNPEKSKASSQTSVAFWSAIGTASPGRERAGHGIHSILRDLIAASIFPSLSGEFGRLASWEIRIGLADLVVGGASGVLSWLACQLSRCPRSHNAPDTNGDGQDAGEILQCCSLAWPDS